MEIAVEQSNSQEEERENNGILGGERIEGSSSPRIPSSNNKDTTSTSTITGGYDDEEEEDVCRICRNPGDSENPLRYPCACSGSIKFVHQDCLLQWLNHSNARQCEV